MSIIEDNNEFEDLWSETEELCRAKSYNDKTTFDENETKLVIVGTITPPNTAYFYCSMSNRIYGYIDEAIGTNLKELKGNLYQEGNNEEEIVDRIKGVLKDNKIAFVDVMDRAIRKDPNSSRDVDIAQYILDYEMISKVCKNDVTIIVNSRLAERLFKKINNETDYKYLSQRRGRKDIWIQKIRQALGIN